MNFSKDTLYIFGLLITWLLCIFPQNGFHGKKGSESGQLQISSIFVTSKFITIETSHLLIVVPASTELLYSYRLRVSTRNYTLGVMLTFPNA